MSSPWTKKNPFMSLWLSGANAVVNRARGEATATAKRQGASLAKSTANAWTQAWLDVVTGKRRR
jgi:hypothetical protein